MSGFFLWTILQKGSERCVLFDFDLQNYPSPVLWRWFSMYPRVSKLVSTTRICAMVIVKTFLPERCWGEHRRSSRVITAGSRWQCSGLRCGRSSDSIAEETDSSPDPEEERQQHSCSSLLSISLTSEFAHTTSLSQSSLFFWRQELPREGISRGLIDRSTHAWGFDASNPSWVKHRRMHRCVVATPFFFIPLPPNATGCRRAEKFTACRPVLGKTHLTTFPLNFFYEIFTEDASLLFYTMVQKSQKWPKTQIKGS